MTEENKFSLKTGNFTINYDNLEFSNAPISGTSETPTILDIQKKFLYFER